MRYINVTLIILVGLALLALVIMGGNDERLDKTIRIALYLSLSVFFILNYKKFMWKNRKGKD